jgi:hypothetical protein
MEELPVPVNPADKPVSDLEAYEGQPLRRRERIPPMDCEQFEQGAGI